MQFISFRNFTAVSRSTVPVMPMNEFCTEIRTLVSRGLRVVLFFGMREPDGITIYAVLADDERSALYAGSSRITTDLTSYPSLTTDIPSIHLFERELWEETGIVPEGHPWLKPVRFGHGRHDSTELHQYPFFHMEGSAVHEVAVGPVHAGVIEPGHFRFQCTGETVHHLEIQLGYQHRGVEELFCTGGSILGKAALAESIAGDSALAHTLSYAQAVESLCGIESPIRAQYIRSLCLELERTAIHIGTLSALANDVGYLTGNAFFSARRTSVINALLLICGSRFGRGLIRTGGVQFDIDNAKAKRIVSILDGVLDDCIMMGEAMFDSAGVRSRFENTGVVSRDTAHAIGLVGVAAKASGLKRDVRSSHPSGAYRLTPVHTFSLPGGDVFTRAYIRFLEIQQSLRFVRETLQHLPGGELSRQPERCAADSFAVSLNEGPRGEIAHAIVTGPKGTVVRYKVKDASFHNWFGLACALREEGISDFPLCNKSFDLSYAGFDL
ncbi:MAG: NADH-quinone oxidoreductase subunit C [Spirochaetes bacterium]|nr:NADH-quinone oxidoreductase subunit C [Spirochaetota bacterium]